MSDWRPQGLPWPPVKSMCFGNRCHQCFNRWHRRSAPVKKHMTVDKVADMKVDLVVGKVADMKVDKVVDMKVDLVVSKVVNRVAHMVADMDFSIIFWAFLGEFFCNSQ